MNREELLKGLTPEQIEKARACHNSKELLEAAKQEGLELTEHQLEAVSGGQCAQDYERSGFPCPVCGGTNTKGTYNDFIFNSDGGYKCHCSDCGANFEARG